MTTHNTDEQHLFPSQISKRPITTTRPVKNAKSKIKSTTIPPPSSSSDQLTNTIITHTETTPKTRIVVVRSAGKASNEEVETTETKEHDKPNSIQFPPVLTDGRTSVYLIRRPIPPPELSVQTKIYVPPGSEPPPPPTDDLQDVDTSTPTEDTVTSPSQVHSSVKRPKTSKQSSTFTRSESPQQYSPVNIPNETLTIHSPDSSKQLISSPTQSVAPQQIRYRSRSKSRTRNLVRSDSRNRSISRHRSRSQRRISPTHRLSSASHATQEEPKDTDRKRNFPPFSQIKTIVIQSNSVPSETTKNEQQTIQNIAPTVTQNSQRKRSPSQRVKSSKSIVLLNPEDQTIAVVENPYVKGESIIPDGQSKGESDNGSRWNTCLDCLSRRKCLVIIICVILAVIGLAGVGVSAYFLANNSQTNLIPKIVGIVVGGILAIIALTFLYCVLACIDSRDGYFSYNDDAPHGNGRAFALIPSSHPNGHLYDSRDNKELHKNNRTSSLNSVSTRSTIHQKTINRQKSIKNDINSTTNAKNIIIQMPERLLTARKESPKSRERKLNNVVNNIGRIVQDAKKRYNGDVPNKIIVKVDENVQPST
ncbi:unnamed protein product [Rotaria sp. Silwood2]|nr:unnamed protein product [Rotaria sp. Silwood2]CAF3291555.1 unnamed protein product [Rotaria sp. Silwood2]